MGSAKPDNRQLRGGLTVHRLGVERKKNLFVVTASKTVIATGHFVHDIWFVGDGKIKSVSS